MRALVLLLATLACRGGADTNDKETAEPAEHPDVASADGGPSVVTIDKEMMRDLRVTYGKATLHAAGESIEALGEVHVNEDRYAEIAAPVAARVARVLAKPGDTIAVGQVVAELRSPELSQSRAEAEAAHARVDVARANAERKRKLAEDRLVPEREKIEAEAALTEAEAAYNVAQASLRRFGGAAGDATIALKSPVAGTVIDRDILVGQLADPAKTLFKVGDLSTLWLVAHVYERDAIRVPTDATASVTFAALPGKPRDAKVAWIGREVDPASRTIAIRLEVDNADGVLRPGMTATVAIPLGDPLEKSICVPAASVQRVDNGWAVFVPRSDNSFTVRPIGRGRDMGGEVEVLSGLKPDEKIVVGGAFLLKAEVDKSRGGVGED